MLNSLKTTEDITQLKVKSKKYRRKSNHNKGWTRGHFQHAQKSCTHFAKKKKKKLKLRKLRYIY